MKVINPERFYLTTADKMDPLWRRLSAHLEDRINTLRVQNDADISLEKTSILRGRIVQLKELIALGNDDVKLD